MCYVNLSTIVKPFNIRADIDFARVEADTTYGKLGVKVWIYRGEVLPEKPNN